MAGTDKFAKDVTNMMVPVSKLGGLVAILALCGAAGYQIKSQSEQIMDHEIRLRPMETTQAVIKEQLKHIVEGIDEIKEHQKGD